MPSLRQSQLSGQHGSVALMPPPPPPPPPRPPWFPPSDDIFWLHAAFRLPDGATTLTEYDLRRAAVFQRAGRDQEHHGDGADVEMMDVGGVDGSKTAWEIAWDELRTALCK